jgi:diguanylate cyclase (GGDEF)-like protein/PAS domain S-box-containing protein
MDTFRLEQQQAKLAEEVVQAIGEQVLAGLTFDQTVWLICRRFVESLDYPLIWIGTKEPDGAIKVRSFGGKLGHLVENYQEYWKGKPEKQGAAARAIRDTRVRVFNEEELPQLGPQHSLGKQGIQSGLVIPLAVRNQVLGVFNVYAYSSQTFKIEILRWLESLANQLSLGLYLAREYDYLRLQGTGVSSAEQAVCIANPDGCIEWVNEAYCRVTGYGVGEVIGTLLPSFPSEDIGSRLKKRKPPLPPGQFWRTEFVSTHKDGSVYTVEQILTPLLDEEGLLKNFVSVLQDVTARKKIEAQMVYRAHHDPLTDLPNRVMFHDRLTQALAWARRHGRLVSVMFLDLDRFKQINDEFGHGTGDKILQTVAARLNHCVRATDTVARLSGDEFTVILQDVQRVQDVYRVAQKILDRLEQPLPLEGQTLSTKTSMGIAVYPLDGTDPDVLLQRADRAMYKAKGLGGQCCRFASEELNVQFAQQTGGQSKPSLP